jgi:hypothetical protein
MGQSDQTLSTPKIDMLYSFPSSLLYLPTRGKLGAKDMG